VRMRLASLLYSSTKLQMFENLKAYVVTTVKITDNLHCKWKLSCVFHKLILFVASKDEWDTKEGTGTVTPWRMYCMYSGIVGTKKGMGTDHKVIQQKPLKIFLDDDWAVLVM